MRIFTPVTMFTRILLVTGFFLSSAASAEWLFDFSRRTKDIRQREMQYRQAAQPKDEKKEPGFFDVLFESSGPVQEMVLLNTDKGFVPSKLNVKVGHRYKINVVNVNSEQKNVSFVMDAFSQHHATYYGKIKTFHIEPKKDGIFTFVCPETSAQGRLVVFSNTSPSLRLPAGE